MISVADLGNDLVADEGDILLQVRILNWKIFKEERRANKLDCRGANGPI